MTDEQGDWGTWARRVLGDIERLDKEHKDVCDRLDKSYKDIHEAINLLRIEIAVLKTRAGMYGAIWGAIVGLVTTVIAAAIIKHI
jgi:hypothetical protein